MPHTVISSATKEVVIGPDRPFVVIGERINPTGRKALAAEMKAGDFSRVEADALAQVAAGATMLDVNAGIPLADEPAILAKSIELVQSSVLPLVKKYGCAVVAISNDDSGISQDLDVRFQVAKTIVERAEDHGIPRCDVVVDPLAMPIGAIGTAGRQVMKLVARLRDELGVNSTCGASNISFGLPNRTVMNTTFVTMAAGAGLTSAIVNPLHPEMMSGIRAANVINATDKECAHWIASYREKPVGDIGRRRGGRRARTSSS
ncbi:MAG: dihydropteroate synthase [Deltaproteobacteria bacterium]|nr:dihydropteroate synthase [Deltaproteobacteria bacterium]